VTAPARPVPRTEMDVLLLMAAGRTLVQIAAQWGVSTGTVHEYAERLRRRLGAETNPHAVLLACRAGLLDGRPQRHGDHAGYEAHRRRGEDPKLCQLGCPEGEAAHRKRYPRPKRARQAPQNAA
jgi:DNA-binding CsgD family transcriptional regulator